MLGLFSRHPKRDRGIAVLFTALLLVIAVPMMGLMFDSTLLFLIKARLQGAVDGAALAGARALARGADSPTQVSAAQTAASNYVMLNYPSSFFFSGTPTVSTPTVDLSVAYQRSVSVNASVRFPGLFLQYMTGATTVNASASTVRKDVNVVMVVDRSGSLAVSGSCAPLMAAAVNFVGQFAPGRDQVGLVTFASSTYVNFATSSTFQSANPNITSIINGITCAGSTSSAMGLWTGYQQLIGINQPGALNAILFFTDGQPSGVALDMPVTPSSPCSASSPGSVSGSNRTIPSTTAPDAYTLATSVSKGYIRGLLSAANTGVFVGLLNHLGTTGGNGLQNIVNGDIVPATNSTGCTYYSGWSNNGSLNNMTAMSDFAGVPVKDIFGNSTNTTYQAVTLNSHGLIDLGVVANANAMAMNAADSAATNIRNGATDPVSGNHLNNILIYSIGLGNASIPASPTFLERVSNDPRSPIYDSTKPAGKYIYAASTADLQAAFSQVASEILRLAK